MTAVTISRELGSGGYEIGLLVAKSLAYDFVDKQVIEGIFRQYGLTKFDDLYSTMPSILDLASHTNLLIVSMLNEIMEALARRGNALILGRGGFAILGDFADVLNVRIHAPLPDRAQRVMEREHLANLQEAEELIAEDDKMRRKFVQLFYDKQWDAEGQFDMVLDTGMLTLETAAEQIIGATRTLAAKTFGPDEAITAEIDVDPVLADAISKVLANPLPTLPAT